jgi:hypothetical protein
MTIVKVGVVVSDYWTSLEDYSTLPGAVAYDNARKKQFEW